jgi:hypothetical protein
MSEETLLFVLAATRFFAFVGIFLRLTRPLIHVFKKAHKNPDINTWTGFVKTLAMYFSRVPETIFVFGLFCYYVFVFSFLGASSSIQSLNGIVANTLLAGWWWLEAFPRRHRRVVDQESTKTHFQ